MYKPRCPTCNTPLSSLDMASHKNCNKSVAEEDELPSRFLDERYEPFQKPKLIPGTPTRATPKRSANATSPTRRSRSPSPSVARSRSPAAGRSVASSPRKTKPKSKAAAAASSTKGKGKSKSAKSKIDDATPRRQRLPRGAKDDATNTSKYIEASEDVMY
jgi:hypothetical protein